MCYNLQNGHQGHLWSTAKRSVFPCMEHASGKMAVQNGLYCVVKKMLIIPKGVDVVDLWPRNQTGYLKAPYYSDFETKADLSAQVA